MYLLLKPQSVFSYLRVPQAQAAVILLLVSLSLLLGRSLSAAEPELRLSGTAIVSSEVAYAVIEDRDGRSRRVAIGETIRGWGRVIAIELNRIVVETDAGAQGMVLSGGDQLILVSGNSEVGSPESMQAIRRENPTSPSAGVARARESWNGQRESASLESGTPISGAVAPEFMEEVERLAVTRGTAGEDLNVQLPSMLGLPQESRIVAVDHEPVSSDASTLKRLNSSLEGGSVVRLTIEGGGLEAVYVTPSPDGSQGALQAIYVPVSGQEQGGTE